MDEKEIRRELRRVRHRESILLSKSQYGRGMSLESVLSKYIPDKLEQTLDSAFREAFRLIFSKGTPVIGKTFNERKLKESEGAVMEVQKRWAVDMLMTSVEGAGLGLIGVGLPDIPVFTGMLLRTVYQSAIAYGFEYATKTEQLFILRLIEAALTRGKKAEELSNELDDLMRQIDEEGYDHYGNLNEQIERTSKALSDETLYLKFVQTIPVVGIAGGLSNPVYMNKIKNYAEVKYKKRRLLIQQRQLRAEKAAKAGGAAPEPAAVDELEPAAADGLGPATVDGLGPATVDELEPAAVDELEPAAADELEPAAVDGLGPATVDELEPAAVGAPEAPADRELSVSVYDPDREE